MTINTTYIIAKNNPICTTACQKFIGLSVEWQISSDGSCFMRVAPNPWILRNPEERQKQIILNYFKNVAKVGSCYDFDWEGKAFIESPIGAVEFVGFMDEALQTLLSINESSLLEKESDKVVK